MPRAIWSGAVSFGLVAVPVKLYSATASKKIAFHQVDRKTGARVRNKRVSERTGREVDYDDIVKGYEIGDDTYVLIDPEELEAVDPKKTNAVDIEDFVELADVDPIFFDKTYFLAPDKGGEKAYGLLLRAMEETGKAAIGRFVLRDKEHLAALRPYGARALALHTMLFHDEIVDVRQIDAIPDRKPRVGDRELKMARQLVDSLTTEFDPAAYKDDYRARVQKLIDEKSKGKTITIEPAEETPKVVDLLEALKASVEGTSERKKPSRRRKSA